MLNEVEEIEGGKLPLTAYLETIKKALFDTEMLAQSTTTFFVNPRGTRWNRDVPKSLKHTNMTQSGCLAVPETSTITHRPRVTLFVESGLVDLNRKIWRESMLEFCVNSKRYFEGPVWMFASPVAVLHGCQNISETDRKRLIDEICYPLKEHEIKLDRQDPFYAAIESPCYDFRYAAVIELPGDYGRAI